MGERVFLAPITDSDVGDVATFLHAEMNDRVEASAWATAMRSPWQHEPPNHGFHLRVRGNVVGAYVALYSERSIDGCPERFCNLAAWCVREDFRFKGLRMLDALLAQDGYHFVDLSPSGNVIALNERLGFRHLDTSTVVLPNLPWPTIPRSVRLVTNLDEIGGLLAGDTLELFCDHRGAAAARLLVLERGSERCLVVYRRVRRKDLPLFAAILYVSDRSLFRDTWRVLSRHLLVRHAVPFTLVEPRITGVAPWPSFVVASPRPKMFRSDRLDADQIDDLYSELTALDW